MGFTVTQNIILDTTREGHIKDWNLNRMLFVVVVLVVEL